MDLQLRLLEEIRILEKINEIEDKVIVFKTTRSTIQELYNNTTLGRKELKFVLNSLRGLIDGFEIFTFDEVLSEVKVVLRKLADIKEHLISYMRNATFKAPERSSYLDLEPEHFLQLAKLQGSGRVLKSLIELKWEEPSLSSWADNLINFIETHKNDINKKGSFKDQLANLKNIGMGCTENIEEKGTLTLESANYLQKLAKIPHQLLGASEERGWIECPVFIRCFDQVILRKLRELGYQMKVFAGQYVAIQSARCYGLSTKFAASVLDAIKVMSSSISQPFIPVGAPVFCGTHYYWLCFEFLLASNIKLWNLL